MTRVSADRGWPTQRTSQYLLIRAQGAVPTATVLLALSSVDRVAQSSKALHDSTASLSIQIGLSIRHRIYEFRY